ncbi:Transformation/transcription domain-associated protein [Labeo rohita]|uniref:Transformation/transcription domain-associated protein n=8 Tax=Clupeocephala TaxID=186625 RepID=A0ABQ8M6P3_LABRO|nr:Transformation/transcription domain-associated protein [Labeo rohita]
MSFVPTPSPTVVDQTTLMKKYLQFVAALTDNNTPDETKLKMMQEVSENFENVTSSPQYSTFLEHIIPRFLTFLQDGEQLRKLVLEIIHRIPTNEHLRPHAKNILSVMFRFLEIESEENVLICLRIIIELHKQFRPPISQEIHHFLDFVKQIYKELPKVVARYFENPQVIAENTVPSPEMVGMITSVLVKTAPEREDSETRTHTIIPRGSLSLKVLAELPIIVVLMYQLYKLNIHNVVSEFVPLIMNTIMLQVSPQARQHKLFNKELYADFIAAQIKTLSFLAYIIRIYQDLVGKYSQQMVKGMLQLLSNCPPETAHLRKELLIAAKHILTTDLRSRESSTAKHFADCWQIFPNKICKAFAIVGALASGVNYNAELHGSLQWHLIKSVCVAEFIPCMDKLFDESILIGSGYTARETLRPLAYSTLADLVHHVRQNLPLTDLSLAVQLFAKNIDDESLPSSIQTMSCKLLLNLVDCIRSKSEQENGNGRDILMRMLEVFVLKFHTIARYQLVSIFKKCKPQSEMGVVDPGALPGVPATPTVTTPALPPPAPPTPVTPAPPPATPFDRPGDKEDKQTFQVSDCRSLVKTLVCGVKTITWGITSCKAPGEAQFIPNKQLQPKETQIYIKLVKYAMQALDIYQIAGNGQTYVRVANCQTVRMKEEKEVLEHFAGVFTMMNPLTFKEIFQTTVPYMVERISKNYALQIVANSFLANLTTSALFATILVEYLLERLPEMGSNVELSNLYLKLFKLVFGSVSLFAAENEQMLKPHLHKIVNSSMELAQSAKEPYNYFLLLRALFRSIGGGSHDLLYQEFLPLLPNLLQGLNMLQSGLHKQHMKDLFVELCLTVPVRLSSLLPYLPMLMDPLVSALNGSQTLVSQGLRTLELCVDNLQPDFLYDHIQPVRAELMQALWRTLRNPAETISHVAYRVLGKFGGSNRKMLKESQKLQYVVTEVQGPSIKAEFTDCKASIQLPMEKAIETALDCLKSANTEPYYRRQAWEVIKCFLVAMTSLEDNKHALYQLLAHPNFTEKWIPNVIISHRYKAQDTPARRTFEQALTGAFMSAVIKDLRPSALPFVASLIRHYTMVAVAQQCGPFLLPCYQSGSQPSTAMFHSEENGSKGMDPLVLIDAIAICMAYEEKELCKIGEVALAVIFDVASIILGSKERACQLPLFSYIVERLCACCYEQAWYAKLGGVVSIKFLMERLPLIWVLQNQLTFLKALLFVMMDLTGEVSNGAVAMAKTTLEQLLIRCATPLKDEEKTEDLLSAQDKSFHLVTHDLVREVTSPNSTVRKQAMHSLQVLAQVTGKSVTIIMEPHKEVLQDMVPPKKHLLRHQPANAQIGLMEGNTFCTTLQPRLFTMDLNVVEHKVFYTELLNLCESEDAGLMKLPCYKSLPSLVPLRIAALNALAACNYLPQSREKIIAALFKALNSTNSELQEAGEACMRKFLEGATIEVDQIHTHMRPLLMMLGDYRSLTLNVVNRLTSVTRLFPNSFNDKFCDQMMQHLRKWMEVVVITHKGGQRSDGSSKKGERRRKPFCFHASERAAILSVLFTPCLSLKSCHGGCRGEMAACCGVFTGSALIVLVWSLCNRISVSVVLCLTSTFHISEVVPLKPATEMRICSAIINLFHLIPAAPQTLVKPLLEVVMKTERAMLIEFLTRHPSQTVELFMMEATLNDPQWSRMFMSFLKHKDAKPLRDVLASNPNRFVPLLVPAGAAATVRPGSPSTSTARLDLQFQAIKIISIIVKNDEGWLAGQHSLARMGQRGLPGTRNYSEIELLFQLLRAFTGRFLCNMTFLKEYMEEEIPKNYSITHKRALFFRFVEFNDPHFNDELKAKVLQHILNPAFLYSFEKGEGEQLLGPPNPEGDNPESITSVFITKVLDPEKQADLADSLRIYLLQFSTLLVEHAPHHIHDNNKSRNSKLRRLMTFAWPCLLPKTCVDPACKYSGHLLLAHIIAKFAIHKKIVLQVFHSLLKAHTMEARAIVRQAMAILTPAVPARMEDGHQMLTHWTRKIIVEEGHTVPQLVHILHLIVQHFRVYYPVRHHLVQHMISAMQRLGFTPSVTIEQRKLAVDLAEVVIKWELQRIKDQQPESEADPGSVGEGTSGASSAMKRGMSVDSAQDVKRFRTAAGAVGTVFGRSQSMPGTEALLTKPVEKQHTDTVVNFLIRIACQVNDSTNVAGSPGELLSRRCVNLMKTALRPDMWPRAELKLHCHLREQLSVSELPPPALLSLQPPIPLSLPLSFHLLSGNGLPVVRTHHSIDSFQGWTRLEILSFLLSVLQPPAILAHFKPLQRGIAACMTCGNTKVLRAVHSLLSRLMSTFPTEPSTSSVASKYEELECLYAAVGKVIYEGLTNYEKASSANPTQLFGTLMILKSACSNNSSYIDRLISVFMRSLQKMVREHLSPQPNPGAAETSTGGHFQAFKDFKLVFIWDSIWKPAEYDGKIYALTGTALILLSAVIWRSLKVGRKTKRHVVTLEQSVRERIVRLERVLSIFDHWVLQEGQSNVLPVLCCLKASRCNVTLTASPKTPSQRESVANWKSASNIFSPKALHAKTQSHFPRFQQAEFCILCFISSAVFYNFDVCSMVAFEIYVTLCCVCEPACSISSLLGLENHRRPVNLNEMTSELVMLSLDLVKERLSVMNMEMRKNFIQVILTSLIEKSPDPKILRAVVKIVEEWVKNNSGNPMATNQVPNPREKSILLVKMMTYIEKRFPDDLELNAQFLDLVNYVYRDENLSGSDITSKLEPAFLSGLRCTQPLIRAKFFEVFDASMKRRVYERLLYICCSQNWEAMGSHFWIKQCIELLLAVCERNTTIGTSCQGSMLPSITNVINLADSHDRAAFAMATHIKQEPRERENSETKEEDVEIDIELAPGDQTSLPKTKEQAERDTGNQLHMLTNRHDKFLDSLREVKTGALLNALVQLCHISTPLAEKTWVQLFPRLWKILSDRQQHRDCQPSALNCFVEAMSQCVPPIPIRPCVLKYLGKTHNLWLRSTLMLEQQAFEKGLSLHIKPKQSTEFYEQESITPPQQEILDSLAELYSLLQEEDMWAGLWQKRCKFPETSTAIAYEQHGFFEQAQETYEKAMEKARKEHNVSPAIFPEYQLWEDHWIRCSKELNQWEPLTEYGQSKGHNNPYLVLECAWRVSNWAAMKEALVQVELSCPKEMAWKVNMHRGYLAICHPEEQQLNFIERLVEMASSLAIREWRRLPHIVSHVHTPLLQAAQQIIELQEAAQINAGLQPANLGRNTSLHDMKTVVKTWRNRLPIVSDDLSHWSSIFMWRQHHYQAIVTAYETNTQHDPNTNNAMLGVHASASAIIQYGKIARKQGLVNVALDILSRIHTIPTVPIVDCFQKIRQQLSLGPVLFPLSFLWHTLSHWLSPGSLRLSYRDVYSRYTLLSVGLEVIESTNLKYFTKEMTAEFYALKGMFLAQINKSEEANKAFSAAVQMHDVLVKAWAMWGDYLENIFVKDRQPHLGVSAITCYLHACRHQNESKSRKYLAKVLWLLSFDDKNTLADAVDKYCIGVPPIQWLAWIPQLLTCLVGSEGKPLLNLISQVGRVYPQAVYFPIRTLYLTLKIEQRERYKSDSGQQQPSSAAAQTHSASDPGPIRATAPMWRCSRIMHMQRELHPTLLSSLEGIVDQMVWFRENWHEEVLRQLQQGLAKCYSVAFEKSGAVSDAKITPHTLNFVKKLVSTFGVGLENVSNVSTMFSSAASESLARRAQATAQDPVFQKMKGQFTTVFFFLFLSYLSVPLVYLALSLFLFADFDFSVPGSMKLHNLISKLKKWIKILEAKTKQLPKFFLIEEKCRFLSNFSAQTAEVEIPGEFLMPKPTHYYIKIARFMPRVEIVQKHNTAARRLYIRGHNGKIYPYLVMNDACLTESRREERVLQLLRLLNPCLEKRKETTKRHLFFTVPRVVAVSPQMRLVEDNPSSLSLVEIYKQRCAKKGIEHDNPISRYYDRLATVQARGTQASHQGNMVPRSMLKEWALHTFPNATDYWTFRKMFTIQLALIGLAEFMLHLNRLNPEMLQIAQDTGKINVSYFRFDINDATGDLDANRPVPFRLTPNISEFLTTIGVSGPLTASMIAVARCFAQPNFKVDGILKAVLRDEIIAWHKKTQEDTSMPLSPAGQPENMDSQQLVSLVQKAVTAIMTRLHNLAQFEGGESKVNTLVAAANSLDNLCRMDPAWHPWL